jgi:hypothetical protein
MLCDSEHTLPLCSRETVGVLESEPTVDISDTFKVAPIGNNNSVNNESLNCEQTHHWIHWGWAQFLHLFDASFSMLQSNYATIKFNFL